MIRPSNTHRAVGLSPRGSSQGENPGHAGRSERAGYPRGLKPTARGLLVLGLLLATSVHADTPRAHPAADPANPPQGVFGDYWMTIMLQGQKMGYVHSEQERREDRIHTRMHTQLAIKRAEMSIKITMKTTSTETITGQPLAFTTEENFAQFPILRRAAIRDGTIMLETEQFGQKNTQEIPYPAGALMEWGVFLETLKHKPEPGTIIKIDAFVPAQALNVGLPTTVEILAREEIEILGERISAWKTKTSTRINGIDIEALGWVDDELNPIKQEMEIMGLKFEMLLCDKATALKDAAPAEIFLSTLIPINRRIDREHTRSVTFSISGIKGAEVPEFPKTGMQEVVSRKDGEITLRVTRLDHKKLSQAKSSPLPAEFAEYLEASVVITSNDPGVMELARSAAGGEKDPYKLAVLLCHRVAREIEHKDLGTAFATAAEVCRNKTGDCTEHGVLLAALGRAVGIPARVATGLIYVSEFGGRHNVLGFHMWTQFWIAGQWVDLDAAWNQVDVDPTHITLGTHSLKHGSVGSLISSVMLEMDKLRFSVMASDPNP